MALSILSSCKHSIKIISMKNNLRLISNVPFNESFILNKYKGNVLFKKVNEVNDWYIQFTGLDEVKRLQDKVIITQERLEQVQEERREKGKIIVEIRKNATILQQQLHQVNKFDNIQKFVDLTQKEAEIMKKERELTAEFEILDKQERELFSTLCNTIRDSHEKEKAQSEYTKYWGIILSIIGTIVGAVISTVISTIRNKQIIYGINKNIETKFDDLTSMYKMDIANNDNSQTNVSFLRNGNQNLSQRILNNLSENLKEMQGLRNDTRGFNDKLKDLLDNMADIKNKIDKAPLSEIKVNDRVLPGRVSPGYQVGQIYTNELQDQIPLSFPAFLGLMGSFVVSTLCCMCR